jgi:inner membrane protein
LGRLKRVLPGWWLALSVCALAAAPDLDLAGRRLFGITEESLLYHRGLFHSPFFLLVLAAPLAAAATRRYSSRTFLALWLLWAGAMLTHPLLDALTDGGRGIMLLLPFSRTRLFFPWRPIYTPPAELEHIVRRALLVRRSEIPFCVAAVFSGSLMLLTRKPRFRENKPEGIRHGCEG